MIDLVVDAYGDMLDMIQVATSDENLATYNRIFPLWFPDKGWKRIIQDFDNILGPRYFGNDKMENLIISFEDPEARCIGKLRSYTASREDKLYIYWCPDEVTKVKTLEQLTCDTIGDGLSRQLMVTLEMTWLAQIL